MRWRHGAAEWRGRNKLSPTPRRPTKPPCTRPRIWAWKEYKRELIAEFQKYLREYNKRNNIEWISDEDEVWRYYQTLRLPLARAAFRNAPLNDDGTLAISTELSAELQKAARRRARYRCGQRSTQAAFGNAPANCP